MNNYVLGVDVWEGSLEIDEPLLAAEDVKFFVIRLNDMNGGHHLDQNFKAQWDQAANFIRFPYFVYNPWVDGQQNFNFLAAHMPAGCKRVAIDIEVKYSGITPSKYSSDVFQFISLVKNLWKPAIYTGEWFLSYLSNWPKEDYWWGQYPYSLYPAQKTAISWDELKAKLNVTPFTSGYKAPGPVKLWQCTAERYIMPGCSSRPIDINVWPGTLAELELWTGQMFPVPVSHPVYPSPEWGAWMEERMDKLEAK